VRINDRFGALAEEYHVASRNLSAFKHVFTAHQVHYDEHVQQLVRDAPLHVDTAVRVPLRRGAGVETSLERAITTRVSDRRFAAAPLAAEQLATLLYLANAVRPPDDERTPCPPRRNVPSSGNLGSIEIYPIIHRVETVEPGIYHFDTVRHDLALLRPGRFSAWLTECVFYQVEFGEAAAALVLAGAIGRLSVKYGARGYRLGLLDAGHVSQNIYLTATAMGLKACATAGFIDDALDAALGLNGLDVATLLVCLVGR
jgi:SagB-type dehydrogenase family enzyme